MAGQSRVDGVVVVLGWLDEGEAVGGQRGCCAQDVVSGQRDMLHTFAGVVGQVGVHEVGAVRAFLIERNADHAARRHHHAGIGRHVPVGMQLVNFAEAELVAIEIDPILQAAGADGLRQVVDAGQSNAGVVPVLMRGGGVQRPEVDVVDGDVAQAAPGTVLAAPAVDKIQVRIAHALDSRDHEFARADRLCLGRPCAQFDGAVIGVLGIVDADPDGADTHAIFLGPAVCE